MLFVKCPIVLKIRCNVVARSALSCLPAVELAVSMPLASDIPVSCWCSIHSQKTPRRCHYKRAEFRAISVQQEDGVLGVF